MASMRKYLPIMRNLRSFSTSRIASQEYLVIAQDIQEPETLERRKDARPAHLEAVEEAVEQGSFLWGGAMLNEGKPIGSALLLQADTVAEIREQLKNDPYIEGRVWDPARIQIIPVRTAVAAFERNAKPATN
ncbi:protein of unknown function [Taphrina deformans PYCC 5710]|uniref:YCII-related domain-containing protein n=1 Tax=Taphrina deformans (strain PYCC 5710 / ATCC 11124 / CBS 356.35 / IMI 108563 / JCM 9778 / NBRC 8474) TaxID=1097556 RepID=R4XH16_TAPDE|nr:protein of unknown function [Taphrina deformans PYCC 5710]|eukprot:CCG84983.1 protein of unknown function [Taphrina deformans PYCC 5710]